MWPVGKPKAGPRPYGSLLMFKILILQSLYNISDDKAEFLIRDRYSFCLFLGLMPKDRVPDAKTIWLFRERLTKKGIVKELFYSFEYQLQSMGLAARKGQIVDASFIEAPKQRNTRDENKDIKAGVTPESFESNPHKASQKDVDARWTKKNDEVHYGYKVHVAVDNENKLIREYEVTSAEVHDSKVFIELLTENSSADVWADSAYRSEASSVELYASGYRNNVHKKGRRNKPLAVKQQQMNTKKSKTRVRVEHVFGFMENEQGGLFIRTIGQVRSTAKIGLMNLAYHMRRMISLLRRSASMNY